MSVNTQKLGKAIYEYFLQRTSPNETFKLCIDSYTYEYCAKQAGLSENEIESLLIGDEDYILMFSFDDLAFVALETKIAYDVETDSDLINSYNNRLIEKLSYFKDNNAVQDFYRKYQNVIWEEARYLFAKEKRILDIPSPRSGPGCYVQYPISQRVINGIDINGSSIIRFANRFHDIGLEPGQAITYSLFSKLVFYGNQYQHNEMFRRMIFSFYCVWDGRTYNEIYSRKRIITREQFIKQAKDEILIQLQPQLKVYINRELIDLSIGTINEKYLYRFDDNPYLTRRGIIFIKDDDYNDWMPYSRKIDSDEEVLIITKQNSLPNYVEGFIDSGEVEVISADQFKILHLTLKDRESFKLFRIELKPIPYFSLVGGIKAKRNTYYSFALPTVRLEENEYDTTLYKSFFLDSKEYPIEEGFALLPESLSVGKHCLKLLDSWDSSEMFFFVEESTIEPSPKDHGWIISYNDSIVLPSTEMKNTIIDGTELKGVLNWINRKSVLKFVEGDGICQ